VARGHARAQESGGAAPCRVAGSLPPVAHALPLPPRPSPPPSLSQRLFNTESLGSVPFLVLGNKVDVVGAASEAELRHALGLLETTGKTNFNVGKDTGVRPVEIFMCSVVKRWGYQDGFEWLLKVL
jgi:hypothetical protein